MDLRICIAALALTAGAPAVLGQSTENHATQTTNSSSSWTYDSKTGQISGAASGAKRKAAQEIVALEPRHNSRQHARGQIGRLGSSHIGQPESARHRSHVL